MAASDSSGVGTAATKLPARARTRVRESFMVVSVLAVEDEVAKGLGKEGGDMSVFIAVEGETHLRR